MTFVLWQDGENGPHWAARHTSEWQPAATFAESTAARGYELAVVRDGSAFAVYRTDDRIWACRYDLASEWEEPEQIGTGHGVLPPDGSLDVAVDERGGAVVSGVAMAPDGTAIVVWLHVEDTRRALYSKTFSP